MVCAGFLIASLGTHSDLAKNWSINIASELEDYLDELEGITFAVEDAEDDKLNFAEGDPFLHPRHQTNKRWPTSRLSRALRVVPQRLC